MKYWTPGPQHPAQGVVVETPTGAHHTTLTFTIPDPPFTQPVFDALAERLGPEGYTVAFRGERREIIWVEHPKPNWLVIIGWLGNRTAYLNIPKEEAINRFLAEKNEGMPLDAITTTVDEPVEIRRFHDSFPIYD